jgi:hypothetical protein
MTKNENTVLTLAPKSKVASRSEYRVKLSDVTTSHNPRHPAPDLQAALVEEGYFHERDGEKVALTPLELIHKLVFGEDPDGKAKYVALVDKYENGEEGLVSLARSRQKAEIDAIKVREFRSQDGKNEDGSTKYVERYGIIDGERRYMAQVYNYAKHGGVDTVGAVVLRKITKEQAFDLAIEANFNRRNPSAVEYGHIFREYRSRTNPETGKNYTLKEIAERLNMDYQFVRSREALTYLTESEQRGVEVGRLNVTSASEKGLRIKQGKDAQPLDERKKNRQRALSLTEVQSLFDDSRKKPKAYLEALADVMQEDYETAVRRSDKRIKEAEDVELRLAAKADQQARKAG